MSYADYLRTFAGEFQGRFEKIVSMHNFDLGDEFEIAVCKVIRLILPHRYGVCRGFIVNDSGDSAGDDILIYDREEFPTL